MDESIDKTLLRTGFNLHQAFNNLSKEIQTDPQRWIEIVDNHIDEIVPLISDYHKIATQISGDYKQNGLPNYITNLNSDTLEVMDKFNNEILTFTQFVDNNNYTNNFKKFLLSIHQTNQLLKVIKNNQ